MINLVIFDHVMISVSIKIESVIYLSKQDREYFMKNIYVLFIWF